MAPKPKTVAKPAEKPAAAKKSKTDFWSQHDHLFNEDKRDYRIGRDIQPKRDLGRYVRWPAYVRLQRQRSILKKRLKVPAVIAQFTRTADKNLAVNLFKLLAKYRPETVQEKDKRLKAAAEAAEAKKDDKSAKPKFVKFGLNHVTQLVEEKKAKLVVIAHDVEPIELVVWLPALCRKMDVPYIIVKGKSRLGAVVHQKTSAVLALTEVRKEDQASLEQLATSARALFNDNVEARKKTGGQVMGIKNKHEMQRRARVAAEVAAK